MKDSLFKQQPMILFNWVTCLPEQDCACSQATARPAALFVRGEANPETDCACACAPAPSAPPAGRGLLWRRAPVLHRAPLPAGHELLLSAQSPYGPTVLNRAARQHLDAFARPRPLANDDTATQLATLGLLVPVDQPQPALCPAAVGNTLTAWLHVTNACNLNCSYCYVQKDAGEMDVATGRTAIETVFRTAVRHGFGAVKLKYAGGEPTLNLPLVRLLHKQAQTLAENCGLELRETLITNGVVLTDAFLDWVAAVGLRLAVSLDLSPQVHDAHRPASNGQGTFDQVRRNVERAVAWGIAPHLSITLDGTENPTHIDAVALALAADLPFNLNFVRPAPPTLDRLVATLQAIFACIESNLPRYSLLAILDRANFSHPHYHPCSAGLSYIVVDHQGRISPCQMELGRPVGDLHAADDPLETLKAAFPNPSVEKRADCTSCPWRYGCAGGCPWLARQTGGTAPYCAVYKSLYPELIRLEGLRLLRWAPKN